jgi:hypothetical protein
MAGSGPVTMAGIVRPRSPTATTLIQASADRPSSRLQRVLDRRIGQSPRPGGD